MRKYSGFTPWEVLREDAALLRSLVGTVIQLAGARKPFRLMTWGAAGAVLTEALGAFSGFELTLVSASYQERQLLAAQYPFARIFSLQQAQDGCGRGCADLIVMEPADTEEMTPGEQLRLAAQWLAPQGQLMMVRVSLAQDASGIIASYFHREALPQPNTPEEPAVLTERLSFSELALDQVLEVGAGRLALSPRLAKALRAYGHRMLPVIGWASYLEGLAQLEADACGPERWFEHKGFTLVLASRPGQKHRDVLRSA